MRLIPLGQEGGEQEQGGADAPGPEASAELGLAAFCFHAPPAFIQSLALV
jgi:hypothetical protein